MNVTRRIPAAVPIRTFQHRYALVYTAAPSVGSRKHYSTTKRSVHVVSTATVATPLVGHHDEQPVSLDKQHVSQKKKKKKKKKSGYYPLSRLPNAMLLRSLLVATVSSHRWLLIPALSVLQFLTRSHGSSLLSSLLSVDRNPVLHGILKTTFYNQFCAGETGQETRQCVQKLKDLGFRGVILTYARETVFDHKTQTNQAHFEQNAEAAASATKDQDIEDWRRGTMETAALVRDGDFLAIKLTGAGLKVTSAFAAGQLPPPQMMDALREICADCKSRSVRVIVDAESQHFQHGIALTTLQLMREFNKNKNNNNNDNHNNNNNNNNGTIIINTNNRTRREAPWTPAVVYNTYQAYLKATPQVVQEHLLAAHNEGFTLGLKVVRGAYILSDDRALICDTKQDTDDAYNSIAQGALRRDLGAFTHDGAAAAQQQQQQQQQQDKRKYPFPPTDLLLASHNRESVFAAYALHQERLAAGLPTVPVAFGQLHGMSDEVSFGLLEQGSPSSDSSDSSDVPAAGSKMAASSSSSAAAPDVFKCTTWGSMSECIAYLLRRAVENRDAVLRTRDEYDALKTEVWRRWFSRG